MPRTYGKVAMAVTLLAVGPSIASADGSPAWPDTPVMRLEALAVLQSFNADLLSHDSATLTLDRWCGAHKLASEPKIVAERVKGEDKPATAEVRALLKVGETEPLAYRRVRLKCGERVLSEADNWYIPARLTDEMNKTLNTSDAAFGRVVQPLQFQRRTLSADLLWQPLPQGWEMGRQVQHGAGATLEIPQYVLQHKAFLSTPDGKPFSALVETYTREIFAFAPVEVK